MSKLRLFSRIFLFSIALFGYFTTAILILILCGFNFNRARPFLTKVIARTSQIGLFIFDIKIKKNFQIYDPSVNYLIVSNHLSYLDILIISSFFPSCFVTSVEMKQTPFLGQLCLLGGCLFVERRSKRGLGGEVEELTRALENGLNVAIFPEATSTNGESVIKFKRPLFQAAINAKARILPICLNYKNLDQEKVSLKNRDHVFWYDATPFYIHALKLFSYSSIVAEISILSEIDATKFQDKLELSDKCYEAVSAEYYNIVV